MPERLLNCFREFVKIPFRGRATVAFLTQDWSVGLNRTSNVREVSFPDDTSHQAVDREAKTYINL
jgi:hypothetical protein